MRQAESDLRHAQNARQDGDFDWACFAAQQSAEKALKAAHQSVGNEAWGHSVAELLDAFGNEVPVAEGLMDRARALDKLYIPTRYPNGLPGGAPADCFTRAEADRAIDDAEAVLALCRDVLSR
jgi:HEPN domain-containing protein